MTSTPALATPPAVDAPNIAEAAADLAEALTALQAADAQTARAVVALGRTIGTGVAETVEGLPLDLVLANLCRLIRSDRSTLVTAADVLRSMPVTAGLWLDGQLSWGQVRTIVGRASRLRVAHRETLDRRIAASRAAHDGIDVYGPDGLLDAVDQAADELDGLAKIDKRHENAERSEFLALQQSFDGGLRGFFELGPVNGAKVANAIHANKPAHSPDVSRGERLAAGLVTTAERSLGGGDGRPAKPLIDVLVDTAHLTPTGAGFLDPKVAGALPTLTARILDALATDADLRVTLTEGKRPLATSRKLHADDTPESNKLVARISDRGDRTPGSVLPLSQTHVHHVIHREHGGDHDPDNLTTLADHNHHTLHRHGWHGHLHPTTRVFTVRRDRRVYRSLPRGAPLAPDPRPPPVTHHDHDGHPIPF